MEAILTPSKEINNLEASLPKQIESTRTAMQTVKRLLIEKIHLG